MATGGYQLNDHGGFLDETKGTNWDLIVKIVGLIALVASGLWTLYKFRADRRVDLDHQLQAQQTEAKLKADELNRYISRGRLGFTSRRRRQHPKLPRATIMRRKRLLATNFMSCTSVSWLWSKTDGLSLQ